jgi:DNA/RNA endonuclease YhcR with UshA esterase domain
MRAAVLALLLILLPADEKPITAEEALTKVNQKVTVEMEVKSTGMSKQGMIFLNSMMNYRDGKNFTVVIPKEAVEKFKKTAKTDDLRRFYGGKTVRVTGTVSEYMNRPQIEVREPAQVMLVEKRR